MYSVYVDFGAVKTLLTPAFFISKHTSLREDKRTVCFLKKINIEQPFPEKKLLA